MEIAGRIALVTGAGIGTGRAIALALAAAGAHVVCSDVDADGAGRTAEACGPQAHMLPADLTRPEEVRRLVELAGPQILVNNAGGGGHVPPHFPAAAPEQWGATLDLNLRAPMLATQAALPAMRAAGGGVVVNIASTAALGATPYASPEYGAAKAGLIRFTTALAAVDGVRVTCVVPDWVATERLTPAELASEPPPIPLARVTAAVLDLIADDTAAGRVVELSR